MTAVRASGVVPGLGSYAQWDRRLDGRIAQALASIPSAKGVEFADAFDAAGERGSRVHDPIERRGAGFGRPRNRAGGLEGGVTNGEDVVARVAFKPISTLMKPLASVDLRSGEATGGGAVLLEQNRARMAELGLRVGLIGSVATVTRGIAATMGKRAHLDEPPRGHAARVLKERRDVYADVDASFRVDGVEPHEVALAIAAWLVSARGIRIDVRGSHPYPILVRAGLLAHAGTHLRDLGWRGRVAIVADGYTATRFGPVVRRSCTAAGIDASLIPVPRGRRAKPGASLAKLWDALASAGIGRDGGVIALGGGAR